MASRRRKFTVRPVFSAFVWGVLVYLGINPGEMVVESALEFIEPVVVFAALLLAILVLYFSYDWIVEGLSRSRKAWRMAGAIGIAAIAMAFLAGFSIFTWDQAALVLLAAVIAWTYAVWK
jgi:hypothetical protein